jgi:hypothetical protein
MCGIYYCLLRRDRGKAVTFDMLFRGFNYFLQSLIATLITAIPLIAVLVPGYLLVGAVVVTQMPQQPGGQLGPDEAWTILGAFGVFYLVLIVVSLLTSALFLFVYPLIVDRGLTGVRAVATSARAALANPGGVLGLVLHVALINLVASFACCVGVIFVLPLHYAAYLVAYRQVFAEEDRPPSLPEGGDDLELDLPPDGEARRIG